MTRTRQLVPVLPGVYAHPSVATTPEIRLRAVGWWDPDAILVEAAAARVSYWPGVPMSQVICAVRNRRPPQAGFVFVRRAIPPELIVERRRLRHTRPALTALDLCVETEGGAIDEVLRSRAATLEHLHAAMALIPDRAGNGRRRLLLESRARPWSAAERRMHRLLREAGITGWDGNQPVMIDGGNHSDCALDARSLTMTRQSTAWLGG